MIPEKYLQTGFVGNALFGAAALLILEILIMWLALALHSPMLRGMLDGYHAAMSLAVTFAVVVAAAHASRPHRFKLPALFVFLFIFLLYNPLYPVLLLTNVTGVETIYIADLRPGMHAGCLRKHLRN